MRNDLDAHAADQLVPLWLAVLCALLGLFAPQPKG